MANIPQDNQQTPHQLTTTGNNRQKTNIDTMTDYLENASITPAVHKAAQLNVDEREAALKALKYYRSLSLNEIETILEASHNANLEFIKKRNKRSRIAFYILTGLSIIVLTVLCIFFPDLRYIVIPLVISFESGLMAHSLISKERIKK